MNVAQLAVDALDRFGEYESTYFEQQWYTNVDLMRQWCAWATVLQDKGVRPGDRVVVMMPSCLEVPAAFHALARIGAVIIPLMPQLIAREVKFIVENSGASTIITSPEIAPCILEATTENPECQILVCGETELSRCVNVQPLVQSALPMQSMRETDANDLAVLVYTSGTTGHPKGVMLSHANLISNTEAVAKLFDLPRDERSMMVLPLSHVYGILLMNLSALTGGVSTMLRRFDTEHALRMLDEFRVERCSLVPAMQVAMINHPNREKYDYTSLKFVIAGSAPLSEEVRSEFERLFDCRVVDGYGQSEATCAVSGYHDNEAFVVGSAGRPIPGVEVCVQDDQNRALPAGETGEICIRGPSVMLGYWNDEQASRRAVIDGWLHSGDIGHTNEQGYIFITDRKKDMIIKAGENISPREIEEAIYGLAGVSEVSVYGVPDHAYQEEIAASIVMKPGRQTTADQVREYAGGYISKFKIPKYVMFPAELPKNSNGKVLKRTLREQWAHPSTGMS